MKPEKDIDLPDSPPPPTGYDSHHLAWDRSKKRWALRVTVDMGAKVVGRRLCIRFPAADLELAAVKRDAIIAALRALGLSIRPRLQLPTKGQSGSPGTSATD
jgi:hypothetical protein